MNSRSKIQRENIECYDGKLKNKWEFNVRN